MRTCCVRAPCEHTTVVLDKRAVAQGQVLLNDDVPVTERAATPPHRTKRQSDLCDQLRVALPRLDVYGSEQERLGRRLRRLCERCVQATRELAELLLGGSLRPRGPGLLALLALPLLHRRA